MSVYQLEIKQIVDYPRCRMYREFVQTLIEDRSIHTHGYLLIERFWTSEAVPHHMRSRFSYISRVLMPK